jgi:hypothetical protein
MTLHFIDSLSFMYHNQSGVKAGKSHDPGSSQMPGHQRSQILHRVFNKLIPDGA